MTAELELDRRPSNEHCTIGDLFFNGAWECFTLEDVIREIEGVPVVEWKIKGRSAIPAGRYRITFETSKRFGPNTITINAVPGFSDIRMHAGNTELDTEGCPLTGAQVANEKIVGGTSGPALAALKERIRPHLEAGEEVWITITNPEKE